MDGINKYLSQQNFGESKEQWYQILQWQPSAVIAGVNSVIIPYKDATNTLFIRIYQMSISIDGLGGIIDFNDARIAAPLFSLQNNIASWNVQKFDYLISDSQFVMTCSDLQTKFSLAYCRITHKPEIK